MVRPIKCRMIGASPKVSYPKLRGVALNRLIENHLFAESYEAMHLTNHLGLKHETAVEKVQVSQQICGRTLSETRQPVAAALGDGTVQCIQGGDYQLNSNGRQSPHDHATVQAVFKRQLEPYHYKQRRQI